MAGLVAGLAAGLATRKWILRDLKENEEDE
jgi:hypothetical protein